jgi:hypothetical protein
MKTPLIGCLVLGIVCSILTGCGGKLGNVEGTVKLNGKPLKGAIVMFQPQHEGRPSSGTTDEDGHYVLDYTPKERGAEVGTHTVTIQAPVTKKDKFGEEIIIGDWVPSKYNTKTELKKEVTSGSSTIDFDIESNGKVQPLPKEKPERVDTCCCQ